MPTTDRPAQLDQLGDLICILRRAPSNASDARVLSAAASLGNAERRFTQFVGSSWPESSPATQDLGVHSLIHSASP